MATCIEVYFETKIHVHPVVKVGDIRKIGSTSCVKCGAMQVETHVVCLHRELVLSPCFFSLCEKCIDRRSLVTRGTTMNTKDRWVFITDEKKKEEDDVLRKWFLDIAIPQSISVQCFVLQPLPSVYKDLVCSICQEMPRFPVELVCGHVFCNMCIHEWKLRSPKCPLCRSLITSVWDCRVSPTLSHQISNLHVTCPLGWSSSSSSEDKEWSGCKESIRLGMEWKGVSEHLRTCCQVKVECGACQEVIPEDQLTRHKEEKCRWSWQKCPYCNVYVPRFAYKFHLLYPIDRDGISKQEEDNKEEMKHSYTRQRCVALLPCPHPKCDNYCLKDAMIDHVGHCRWCIGMWTRDDDVDVVEITCTKALLTNVMDALVVSFVKAVENSIGTVATHVNDLVMKHFTTGRAKRAHTWQSDAECAKACVFSLLYQRYQH